MTPPSQAPTVLLVPLRAAAAAGGGLPEAQAEPQVLWPLQMVPATASPTSVASCCHRLSTTQREKVKQEEEK